MVTLRAGFAAEREKADAAGQKKFDAAMATCDLLARALNERQAVIGDIASSKAVQSSGKMEEGGRKDNLQEGLKGAGFPRPWGPWWSGTVNATRRPRRRRAMPPIITP